MSFTVQNTPLGITIPIQDGNSGYFAQSTDSFTQYRMNIINLLRTKQGERRLNPTFGSRLWTVVFEPNDEFIADKVTIIIKEDVAQWIPGITINTVQVNTLENDQSTNLDDTYTLYIAVTFTIDSINQSDVVKIVLNSGKV